MQETHFLLWCVENFFCQDDRKSFYLFNTTTGFRGTMEGIIGAAWNQHVQIHSLQVVSDEKVADDNLWKHKMTVRDVGVGFGIGKTKAEAREAAQLYIFQRFYPEAWGRFVSRFNDIHYTCKGAVLSLEESGHCEFKGAADKDAVWDFALFETSWRAEAGRTVCAFLNADRPGSSTMFFGVHDSGCVQGIVLTKEQRDDLFLMADHLYTHFDPPIDRKLVRVEYKKVESADHRDLYLVVLRVAPSNTSSCTYWYKNIVYERHNTSTRMMHPSKIRQRIQSSMILRLQQMNP